MSKIERIIKEAQFFTSQITVIEEDEKYIINGVINKCQKPYMEFEKTHLDLEFLKKISEMVKRHDLDYEFYSNLICFVFTFEFKK